MKPPFSLPGLLLGAALIMMSWLAGCTIADTEGDHAMPMTQTLKLSSPSFEHEGAIPLRYSCDGSDTNPPLKIEGVPQGTQSLALIMEDPDAPHGTFDHWLLWNIPPETQVIAENDWPEKAHAGTNSFRRRTYGGPCPPSGSHRYFFTLYALDARLNLPDGTSKQDLEAAMQGHILDKAVLMGTYSRQK